MVDTTLRARVSTLTRWRNSDDPELVAMRSQLHLDRIRRLLRESALTRTDQLRVATELFEGEF